MATWTASSIDVTCGGCYGVIPPRQGYALFTAAKLPRCRTCAEALGAVYDDVAVDNARFEIERQERLDSEKTLTPAQAFVQITARIPARQPKSFASLGDLADRFDPRRAAAGDRD